MDVLGWWCAFCAWPACLHSPLHSTSKRQMRQVTFSADTSTVAAVVDLKMDHLERNGLVKFGRLERAAEGGLA